MELTTEQQFHLMVCEKQAPSLTAQQLLDLTREARRQRFIKVNAVRAIATGGDPVSPANWELTTEQAFELRAVEMLAVSSLAEVLITEIRELMMINNQLICALKVRV